MPVTTWTFIERWPALAAAPSPFWQRFARYSPIYVIPREVVIQYVVGAYMAVLTWWLDGGARLPPQRIDAMFRHLATKGVIPPNP